MKSELYNTYFYSAYKSINKYMSVYAAIALLYLTYNGNCARRPFLLLQGNQQLAILLCQLIYRQRSTLLRGKHLVHNTTKETRLLGWLLLLTLVQRISRRTKVASQSRRRGRLVLAGSISRRQQLGLGQWNLTRWTRRPKAVILALILCNSNCPSRVGRPVNQCRQACIQQGNLWVFCRQRVA
jgi:hypothetical protein